MSYVAYNFIFDGVPSEKFDLFICNMDNKGTSQDYGGGNVKLHTDKTPSMDHNYLLGVEYDEVFEFTFTFGSYSMKDRFDISLINNWLIGHKQYKKLQILQEDMTSIFFNCIINDFKVVTFGNVPYAFECNVICDRGWGLENTKTYNYNITKTPQTILHNNTSHTNDITLPILEFTTNSSDATVSIINQSNNDYETKFINLASEETIIINCQTEIIESSMGLRRLNNFNNHWFELLPKQNKIIVTGNVSNVKIKYENIRKVGA